MIDACTCISVSYITQHNICRLYKTPKLHNVCVCIYFCNFHNTTQRFQALQDNMVKLRLRATESLESAYADVEVRVLEAGYASFEEFETARKSVRQRALDEKVCVCMLCVCV